MVRHEAPSRWRHSSSVASGCWRNNSRSRSRSSAPSAGGGLRRGAWFERVGATMLLQQRVTKGDAHQETTSDLAQGTLAALDRIEDPLSEILRIGCHWSPPHSVLLSNGAPSTARRSNSTMKEVRHVPRGEFLVQTKGRSTQEITRQVQRIVEGSGSIEDSVRSSSTIPAPR